MEDMAEKIRRLSHMTKPFAHRDECMCVQCDIHHLALEICEMSESMLAERAKETK